MPPYCQRLVPLSLVCFALTGALPATAAAGQSSEEIPTALNDYVTRPDATFAWQLKGRLDRDQGRVYRVEMTSQTWQGLVWKHALDIHEPKNLDYPRHVLLFITGGTNGKTPGEDDLESGLRLSKLVGARVAILHQVPNQPLLGNRKEDDLISETWLRYLATGDAIWPLLFPMVKSAVRAMDTIEAVAKQEWKGPIAGFVVTGASKRGWTTWLTAAADRRVVGIAPMVIDMLNLRAQMQYQLDTWGRFSEQIGDYTRKELAKAGEESPREAGLRRMMDPYTYRSLLRMPKLIVNGTNDRYWVVDAAQLYWKDLLGPKYVLEVPNAGHGLDGGRPLVYGTLAAFFRSVASNAPLPELQWTHTNRDGELLLSIKSSVRPKAARIWYARSETKDFRAARWQSRPLDEKDGAFVIASPRPEREHLAFFGELQFESGNTTYSLTTPVWRY